MHRWIYPVSSVFLVLVLLLSCSKKNENSVDGNSTVEGMPPKAPESAAPEYMQRLGLLYPQAYYYRVGKNFLQKTNHPLAEILRYYETALEKNNFKIIARLSQNDGALLQGEKKVKAFQEVLSIDVQKLPYADNFLIRVGRSQVDYASLEKRGEP
ncbi:MAG TPA: hypothetical protein PLY93_09290 [Turneriella sp.]|nr:hypothetical protein [Turneriella sp.]